MGFISKLWGAGKTAASTSFSLGKTAAKTPRYAMDYTNLAVNTGLTAAAVGGAGMYAASETTYKPGDSGMDLSYENSALDYLVGGIPEPAVASTGGMIGRQRSLAGANQELLESTYGLTQAYWEVRH